MATADPKAEQYNASVPTYEPGPSMDCLRGCGRFTPTRNYGGVHLKGVCDACKATEAARREAHQSLDRFMKQGTYAGFVIMGVPSDWPSLPAAERALLSQILARVSSAETVPG